MLNERPRSSGSGLTSPLPQASGGAAPPGPRPPRVPREPGMAAAPGAAGLRLALGSHHPRSCQLASRARRRRCQRLCAKLSLPLGAAGRRARLSGAGGKGWRNPALARRRSRLRPRGPARSLLCLHGRSPGRAAAAMTSGARRQPGVASEDGARSQPSPAAPCQRRHRSRGPPAKSSHVTLAVRLRSEGSSHGIPSR